MFATEYCWIECTGAGIRLTRQCNIASVILLHFATFRYHFLAIIYGLLIQFGLKVYGFFYFIFKIRFNDLNYDHWKLQRDRARTCFWIELSVCGCDKFFAYMEVYFVERQTTNLPNFFFHNHHWCFHIFSDISFLGDLKWAYTLDVYHARIWVYTCADGQRDICNCLIVCCMIATVWFNRWVERCFGFEQSSCTIFSITVIEFVR